MNDTDNNIDVAHGAGQLVTVADTVRQDISHKLTLHCGAHAVPRSALTVVATPDRTRTWHPISHMSLIELVERVLEQNKLKIVGEGHSLSHLGNRYFGLFQIQNGSEHDDYAWILGVRNSHDKVFPSGGVAGMSVFICDNLSFSGEVRWLRRHTTFIERDLPFVVEQGIGRLMEKWHAQDERIEVYKSTELTDTNAHDILVRALDVGAMTPTQLPRVLADWRKPRHEEFAPRNVWSLMNCFTEVLKGGLTVLPQRTQALHGLLDSYSGLHSLS
jgi:hypothetical protein